MRSKTNPLILTALVFLMILAVLLDLAMRALGLYTGGYSGILPVMLAGLLLGCVPLLVGLASGRRALVVHPAGLLAFGALVALWALGPKPMSLFELTPSKDTMRILYIDENMGAALLAALALGLSFAVADQRRRFSWRAEALWLAAFVVAGVAAQALGFIARTAPIRGLELLGRLLTMGMLFAVGMLLATALPAVQGRGARAALVAAAVALLALFAFHIVRDVSFYQTLLLRASVQEGSANSIPVMLYRLTTLLFTGVSVPGHAVRLYAGANLLCALAGLLAAWAVRSVLGNRPFSRGASM